MEHYSRNGAWGEAYGSSEEKAVINLIQRLLNAKASVKVLIKV